MKYTIDATGKSLGRLASEVAAILNGKNRIDFVKNKVLDESVLVTNAAKVRVTGNKMNELLHKRYSGFPGGLKELTLNKVIIRKGYAELIKHSIYGMLPKNKLQDIRMKNLEITE
jgi:large subunit ribosomal protein L13